MPAELPVVDESSGVDHQVVLATLVDAALTANPTAVMELMVKMQALLVVVGRVLGETNVATPLAFVVSVIAVDGQPVAERAELHVALTLASSTGTLFAACTTVTSKMQVTCNNKEARSGTKTACVRGKSGDSWL